jgi:hypothetical protein
MPDLRPVGHFRSLEGATVISAEWAQARFRVKLTGVFPHCIMGISLLMSPL